MRYTQIYSQIWYDEKFKQLSNNAKLAFIYILSSPHSNMAGYYRLPVAYISYDMQWEKETVLEALNELENYNMIAYDTKNEIVLVKNFLKYNLIQNTNQAKGILRHIKEIPKSHLLIELAESIKKYASNYLNVFEELFRTVESMKESLLENPDNPLERVSKGFKNPSQTVKEGFQNGSERVSEGLENSSERVFQTSGNTLETLSEPIQNPSPKQNNNKQKQNQKQNNIESVIANAITPRTGSDERTCVPEQTHSAISNQPNHLDVEIPVNRNTAKTEEPLITTGEELKEKSTESKENNLPPAELPAAGLPSTEEEIDEQLLEEFFEDEQATSTQEDNKETSTLPQNQDTADSENQLIAAMEEEIEQLLEELCENENDGTDTGTPEVDKHLIADSREDGDKEPATDDTANQTDTENFVLSDPVSSESVQENHNTCLPPSSSATQQKTDADSATVAVATTDTPRTETYIEEPVEKAPKITNSELIGVLTHKFHEITGIRMRTDYSFIGGLYNKFGFVIVERALKSLRRKIERDGPFGSPEDYRGYLVNACIGINEDCLDPKSARERKKELLRTKKKSPIQMDSIRKQIEVETNLFEGA